MPTFYNDNEPFVARWLENLINNDLLSKGIVDGRPIQQLRPDDLVNFNRVHVFAGIGGWDYALRLAGWPVDRPVWTGSCPCQPFSVAGRGRGVNDERHLWPVWRALIEQSKPATIFGEQVASAAGRSWLAGVFADLEKLGYAVAGADLCAAGVGAPHIRQRLWWVAESDKARWVDSFEGAQSTKCDRGRTVDMAGRPSNGSGWGEPCRFKDGSYRRTKPSVDVLVDGFPSRMEQCGAYGNAIVPQVAAAFIQAFLEAERS